MKLKITSPTAKSVKPKTFKMADAPTMRLLRVAKTDNPGGREPGEICMRIGDTVFWLYRTSPWKENAPCAFLVQDYIHSRFELLPVGQQVILENSED